MAYTKTGPFTNGAAPGIDKAFLDGVETWIDDADTLIDPTLETSLHSDFWVKPNDALTLSSPGPQLVDLSAAPTVPASFTTFRVEAWLSGVVDKTSGTTNGKWITLYLETFKAVGGAEVFNQQRSLSQLLQNVPADRRYPFTLIGRTAVLNRADTNGTITVRAVYTSNLPSGSFNLRDMTLGVHIIRQS